MKKTKSGYEELTNSDYVNKAEKDLSSINIHLLSFNP